MQGPSPRHFYVSPARWREQGWMWKWRGHSVFVAEGQGRRPLLCLHGFPTSSWDWHRIWPYLAGDFRLVAPDLLGFGFSDKPVEHPYRIGEQADLCEDLLRELDIRRCHVLAHDYGDTVAQELLARSRQGGSLGIQLQSVCFLNGGLFPEAQRPLLIQKILAGPFGSLAWRLISRQVFERQFIRIFGSRTRPCPRELEDFWLLVSRQNGVRVSPCLLQYLRERRQRRERWVGALGRAAIPLRLVIGTADPVSGPCIARRYRQLIPEPDILLLRGIGHYPHWEAPRRVARAVAQLTAETGQGTLPH